MDTSDITAPTTVDTPKGPRTPAELRAAVLARVCEETHWYQGAWAWYEGGDPNLSVCGASYCVAGWACVEAGFKLHWVVEERNHEDRPVAWSAHGVVTPGGIEPIGNMAATLLGLDHADSLYLFSGARTLPEIVDCFDALDRPSADQGAAPDGP